MAMESPTTNPASERPKVRLISARELPAGDAPQNPPPSSTAASSSTVSSSAFLQQMTATMSAIAMVLAARFLLLLSATGAFILACLAMQSPDVFRLAINVVYDIGVVAPVTWLYLQKG